MVFNNLSYQRFKFFETDIGLKQSDSLTMDIAQFIGLVHQNDVNIFFKKRPDTKFHCVMKKEFD